MKSLKEKMSALTVTGRDTVTVTPVNRTHRYCYESLAHQTTQNEAVNATLVPSYTVYLYKHPPGISIQLHEIGNLQTNYIGNHFNHFC